MADSFKMKKQYNHKKDKGKAAACALQYYVSQDVKLKNKTLKYGYNNPVDKEKGIKWFNDGFTLEDAPDDMRNNISFVNGFNYAYRINLINEKLFELGIEYYNKGIPLYNIPEKYSDNTYFMDGYNNAMKKIGNKKL